MTSLRPLALALVAAALFGAGVPASKLLLADLSPFQLAGCLYLGAALGVAPAAALSGGFRLPRARDRNRLRLIGAIAAGGVCGPLLLLFGLRLAGAASVSLWLSFEVAATALIGVIFFRDRIGARGAAGAACALAGVALLSAREGASGFAAGGLVLAACACWGVDNHLTALIDSISPSRTAFWKGLAAGAVNLAIGVLRAPLSAAPATIAAAAAVGALAYGASIALLVSASQSLGATRAQSAFASAPFFGALFAMLFLGEALAAAHLAAALLLAAGVALSTLDRHAHMHAHAAQEHEHAHRHDDGHHDHPHPGEPRSLW
ncbi:MAG TPA: EamA family transporter, partial [Myxococcota bacterium]|nr:EamA family transporter [Myxococcota bacterium]